MIGEVARIFVMENVNTYEFLFLSFPAYFYILLSEEYNEREKRRK